MLNVSTGQDRADRAHPDDARQRPRRGRARSTPATSPPPSASSRSRPATRSPRPTRRSSSSRSIFPEPVIKVAVEPKTKADQQKMSVALGRLAEEDPTFRVQTNEETGQTEISGMGELHLEMLVDRMRREYNVEANVGRPQVSYRETVRGDGAQRRGPLRPPDRRLGPVRRSSTSTSSRRPARASTSSTRSWAARSRASSSPRSRRAARRRSRAACSPATRWSTSASTLIDGKYHDIDSLGDRASRSPARWPSRRRRGAPSRSCSSRSSRSRSSTPEDFLGEVIGDLSRRRGRIEGQERRGNALTVTARVPLSEMFGYATDLRSKTQGRATYTMQFDALRRGSAEHRGEGRRGSRRRVAGGLARRAAPDAAF